MIPHERSLVKELKGRPFVIIGVNSDKKEKLKKLVQDKTVTWRSFTDKQKGGSKISAQWGVHAWPTLFLIDHNGIIKHKDLRGKEMEKAICEMIAEAEKDAKK